MGAMTGRAAGYCVGSGAPGYASFVPGRGSGMGFRRGRGARGWRNMFNATGFPGWMEFGGNVAPHGYPSPYQKPDPEMEKQTLENQAEALQSELDLIKKRLEEIEARPTAE